jgi:hypothetical protein
VSYITWRRDRAAGDQTGHIRVWDLTANACSCELVPEVGTAGAQPGRARVCARVRACVCVRACACACVICCSGSGGRWRRRAPAGARTTRPCLAA